MLKKGHLDQMREVWPFQTETKKYCLAPNQAILNYKAAPTAMLVTGS